MFETFPRLTGLFDPISGRRAFSELAVRAHVIDTGERTIVIAEIASVSVGVDDRWPLKIALLIAACGVAAAAVFILWLALFAVLLVVSAVFVRSTSTLAIATNDGSRTFFSSDARAELDEALSFLSEKLNTQDADMMRHFRFGRTNDPSQPSTVKQATVAVDADDNDAEAVDVDATYAETRAGAARAEPIADTRAPRSARDRVSDGLAGLGGGGFMRSRAASDAQTKPNDLLAAGAGASGGQINYASVIAQVTELHRFYAKTPDTKHIEQRLSEMEVLMRSGTPGEDSRERVRQLAGELASIMQAYPPMVQLFQHIATLATPARSAAA